MTATDFIQKWQNSLNYLGKRSVGINVDWDIIPADSRIESFSGKEAWEKIYNCTPPWFKTPQTFKKLADTKNKDYLQIVGEETRNGKIEYYNQNGLREPFFCVFADLNRPFLLLGDGNHRFLDCIYLMHDKSRDFDEDIKRTSVDIIFLSNFVDVLRPDIIWKTN